MASTATSRIFIKNLPPNLKDEDFKKHFSSLAPVTDSKYISKRRIGYVGYKTPDAALQAVKYFNRSFIRLSKINVELARPADEIQPRKKIKLQEDVQETDSIPKPIDYDIPSDPKLQEYLDAMAPSSKSKTWASEDGLAVSKNVVPIAQPYGDEEVASDEEYQTISKKRRRSSEPEQNSSESETKKDRLEPRETSNNGAGDKQEASQDVQDDSAANQNIPVVSDSDWLRSKTSRLLGLLDDDELDDMPALRQASKPSEEDIGGIEKEDIQIASPKISAENQVDNEDINDQTQQPPENADTGRLFLRNLSYGTTETDLEIEFKRYGLIDEVHISKDARSGISKGLAYIQFSKPEDALQAKAALDGKPFQGRLLHILLAQAKRYQGLDEYEISKLPLKKQKEIRQKQEASTAGFKWNSMYMSPDAILSSVASRLGVSKIDVLDPTSSDAAIKQAHAETGVIKEVKVYFAKHGVNLDSFKGREYSDRAILVKNFPYGTSAEEFKNMFEAYGTVTRLLMPPAATIAIVEMEQPTQAKSAFHSLAYRKFKDSVLFLEKAPKTLFTSEQAQPDEELVIKKLSPSELLLQDESAAVVKATLFVRNLNFSTTSLELRDLFRPLDGFLSATVKTKTDPKRPGQTLSMGFGFVEFRSKEEAQSAMSAMNGHKFAGHELLIKESNKAIDAGEERRKEDAAKKLAGQRTKIIIRNLPFEATKKDVRALFGPYGQLRTVRVPKKFDNTSRGFAFAEFTTIREAKNAVDALTGVHLLGRRLNLEYAAGDAIDAEEEIEKMSRKVGKQADKVAVQNLTSGGRKKFSVHQGETADID